MNEVESQVQWGYRRGGKHAVTKFRGVVSLIILIENRKGGIVMAEFKR